MECIWCGINELNKIILGQPVNHIIRVLFWDMHVVILHFCGSKKRHFLFDYKNNILPLIEFIALRNRFPNIKSFLYQNIKFKNYKYQYQFFSQFIKHSLLLHFSLVPFLFLYCFLLYTYYLCRILLIFLLLYHRYGLVSLYS